MQPEFFLDWMHIDIRKESETESDCVYVFSTNRYHKLNDKRAEPAGRVSGRFGLKKDDGIFYLLELVPDDLDNAIFDRAARKIAVHWKNGNLPEYTQYAAG